MGIITSKAASRFPKRIGKTVQPFGVRIKLTTPLIIICSILICTTLTSTHAHAVTRLLQIPSDGECPEGIDMVRNNWSVTIDAASVCTITITAGSIPSSAGTTTFTATLTNEQNQDLLFTAIDNNAVAFSVSGVDVKLPAEVTITGTFYVASEGPQHYMCYTEALDGELGSISFGSFDHQRITDILASAIAPGYKLGANVNKQIAKALTLYSTGAIHPARAEGATWAKDSVRVTNLECSTNHEN